MAKLEYKPIQDWQQFNFIGKRIFDFINGKINITTGTYRGNGLITREIKVDIIPRVVIIFDEEDMVSPIIWSDTFVGFSKGFDGSVIVTGIVGLSAKKDAFIISSDSSVNQNGIPYHYVVFGS